MARVEDSSVKPVPGLKPSLTDGKARLGVWGCGYIGLTTMINFAKEGIYCVGYDVDKNVIDSISKGDMHIPTLNYWLGFQTNWLLVDMIQATTDWQDMLAEDVKVHLIAVPTEKNGEPWAEPLKDVIGKIGKRRIADVPDLVIIESTLTPGMFEGIVVKMLKDAGKIVGKDVFVGLAPRRDWFDSPDKNLKSLTRVIGGTDIETSQAMKDVLGIICDDLITVSDTSVVEMVKALENSILHICATYASQVASAYPNVDVGEVFRLAGTHWRIPTYYPSVGTGGYCIPLSSKYVRDGAECPQLLTITNEVIAYDNEQPNYVAKLMTQRVGPGNSIGILGLSYKRDLKVHTLSPVLRIVEQLKALNIGVKVYDPYYAEEEIHKILDVDSFKYPEELSQFKGLIIVPPHQLFGQTPRNVLIRYLREGMHILDNEGIWSKWRHDFLSMGVDYHKVGDKGWCVVTKS